MNARTKLRVGFIPLADAALPIIAADKGYAVEQGLDLELVREVSWSNIRDKLNVGLFDAAHLLSPIAIASSLGVGHLRVPLLAPFVLGVNGNAVTVSPKLHAELTASSDGEATDPMVSARALALVVAERRRRNLEPLTFGMTFPFSNHNYQLRFWIAAGGLDPDEDVRLVVLPPPYMVESLAKRHVDGFCVGAPWSSVAASLGVGRTLHAGSELHEWIIEKVLAVRASWAQRSPDLLRRLLRALERAARFINAPENLGEAAAILARPDRIGVDANLILRALEGTFPVGSGMMRASDRYIVIGRGGATRPDPIQAAWIYAQMVRWGQAEMTPDFVAAAKAVFRPDLWADALGHPPEGPDITTTASPPDGVGAFAGPPFRADDIAAEVAAWSIRRRTA